MLLYDTRYRSLTIQVGRGDRLHAGRRLAGQQHRPEPRGARQGLQLRLPRQPRRLRHQPDADPLHQRQHATPARRWSASSTRCSSRSSAASSPRSSASSSACCGCRRTGSSPGSPRSTSTASATCRCCSGSSRSWRSSPTSRRRRRRSAATNATASMLLRRRSRSPTAASTCPGRSRGRAGTSWSATFIASLIAIMVFGRYAARRQEATGEILPTFWIKLGLFVVPDAARRTW